MSNNRALPQGRKVHIYRSGDNHYQGTKIHFNPMRYRKMEYFLDEIADKVPIWGSVRSIHTPNTGTEVKDLDSLEKNGRYVAAGKKGFTSVPGGYENIGYQIKPKERKTRIIRRKVSNAEGKRTVWIFRNGDLGSKAKSFQISKEDANWEKILERISEIIKRPIKRMFDLNGKLMDSSNELMADEYYVAAENGETYKRISYVTRKTEYATIMKEEYKVQKPGMKIREPKPYRNRRLSTTSDNGEEVESEDSKLHSGGDRFSRSSSKSNASRRKSSRSIQESESSSSPQTQSLSHRRASSISSRNTSAKSSKSNRNWGSENDIDHIYETIDDHRPSDDGGNSTAEEDYQEELQDQYEEDSIPDSGHGSLLTSRSSSDSVFAAKNKSRPSTTMIIDYDTDDGGVFRAKSSPNYTREAHDILEDSKTKIEVPIDMMEAREVMEEAY